MSSDTVYLAEEIKVKDQRIKQLENALRDMGEVLDLWNETGDMETIKTAALKTLQKHQELLTNINEEKKR